MSTDRELLGLAAWAHGGIKFFNDAFRSPETGYREWNPITDDGDALRLAVKLGLNIIQQHTFAGPDPVAAACGFGADDMRLTSTDYDGDPLAATRRAITRAAAEIGRAMP